MEKLENARLIVEILASKLKDNAHFLGVEIGVLKIGDVFTNDICVRVLVDSNDLKHDDLKIDQEIDDIKIELVKRIIKPFNCE